MIKSHKPRPMLFCTLLRRSTADIEVYKGRNPHKKTFCHRLPLVALPKYPTTNPTLLPKRYSLPFLVKVKATCNKPKKNKGLKRVKVGVAMDLGRGEQQKSLAVLKELHLLEEGFHSIKSTKKRKSVLKLYLVTQISPRILAENKRNQPKLERLLLPPPLVCLPGPKVVAGKKGNAIIMFLNFRPVYKQLVSKMYAISGYHWVQMHTHEVLFSTLLQPCTWFSWVTTNQQALVQPDNRSYPAPYAMLPETGLPVRARAIARAEVGLVKNFKKNLHLLVDAAPLNSQKDKIKSFFRQYLLYLKKLLSEPGNLPLPFLITKLNRSIRSWERDEILLPTVEIFHLYLLALPETQISGVKNQTNDLGRGDSSPPCAGLFSACILQTTLFTDRTLPGIPLMGIVGSKVSATVLPPWRTRLAIPKVVVTTGNRQGTITYGRLPDMVATYGTAITPFHTQGLKKSVLYKTKPKSLEWCKKKQQSQYLNFYISKLLWKLVKKRHPTQSNRWIFEKYWKFMQNTPHFYALSHHRLFITMRFDT